MWVDAVNVGGSAPAATPYHTYLPGVRHSTTATRSLRSGQAPAPTPSPTPPSGGVTVQAEGGAMLYGKGGPSLGSGQGSRLRTACPELSEGWCPARSGSTRVGP